MNTAVNATFTAEAVEFTYVRSRAPAVADVSLEITPGSVHAIIGPNGSGKSTLLKLLLGALAPAAGRLTFAGRDTTGWSRRALARRIGVVTQAEDIPFPMTVHELVAMGRYPHLGPWRSPGSADRVAITQAMERCEVGDLAARPMSTLSGGERQRARLARALAQRPGTLVLDEPTASLDIAHEMAIFELLARLAADDGATVVIVTHQLNLAARYAHRLTLLDAGRLIADGPPADVLERETIERVYGWPVRIVTHPGPGPDAGAPQVAPLARRDGPDPRQHAPGERYDGTGNLAFPVGLH